MFSHITPNHYFDNNVFKNEQRNIFRKNWIFIGFKSELKNPNDFISKKIGGIPVVIQNFNGDIKAFANICSHRFSLLQTEKKGNRGLFCPYHGWAYNKEGKPCGIPKKPLFSDFSNSDLEKLKLRNYDIDYCGDFIFIHISPPTQSLKEYLGDFYDELKIISNSKQEHIDTNDLTIKANWKIIVENTLESYHVNLVHGETFKRLGASGLKFDFSGSHSKWTADLAVDEDDPKLSKIHKRFLPREFKTKGYIHYLVYPNLLISTTYGVSYNISVIDPINEQETYFSSNVFLASNEGGSVIDLYKTSLVDFNRQVFDEDKVICEYVQEGVEFTDQPGILSLEEKRVHSFQENYIKQIQNV
jgi:phenylpropionate dioxygenase-like ring-hydroxylating dioxygenase large terminal subunit